MWPRPRSTARPFASNMSAGTLSITDFIDTTHTGGREGRQGGRETGREGDREGRKVGRGQGGRQGGMQGEREALRQ